MLMTLQNLSLFFGERLILQNITGIISEEDRIGIIGDNGAGKTSLLRIISGEYTPETGHVSIAQGTVVGYLEQNASFVAENTVYEEAKTAYKHVLDAMKKIEEIEYKLQTEQSDALLKEHDALTTFVQAKDGYNIDVQIKKVLNGMNFPSAVYDKKVSALSGGESTRLALAKLLLFAPDIMILDEPTNHLDIDTLNWLESFLKSYKGAIIVVSHDRYFLDQIANRMWEIEHHEMTTYKGNYSAFLVQKEAAIALQEKQHKADVEKAAKLQDYIDRNLVRATTSKMAKSRRKTLEKMEITEKPHIWHSRMVMNITFDTQPYEEVLTVKNLAVKFDKSATPLFEHIDFLVRRSEALVIAGPNGAGKSTLLRVLTSAIKPFAGSVRFGQGVRYSVFEQMQRKSNEQVLHIIWNKYLNFTELEVRNHLAKFGFRGEDVYKPVSALSGGELAKLRFAEIVLEKPNVLLLDEPTNHLDIYTREALGEGLEKYEGTTIVVTHDRYLMQSLNCPILYIENGMANIYANYQALVNRNQSAMVQKQENAPVQEEKTITQNPKEERRKKAELRQKKNQMEEEIEKLQASIIGLENLLEDEEVMRDYEKLAEISEELSDTRFALDELYEQWVSLNEQNE